MRIFMVSVLTWEPVQVERRDDGPDERDVVRTLGNEEAGAPEYWGIVEFGDEIVREVT